MAERPSYADAEGQTSCCGSFTTFMDDGQGGWVECCKVCCEEIVNAAPGFEVRL